VSTPSPSPATQSAARIATGGDPLHDALRQELLRLAKQEDDAASREAALVHYWEPTPVTVVVHRQCAAAMRDAADELLPHCRRPGTVGQDQQRRDT
jgi:hypothetical protein